jgi:hypothetical protein
MRGMERRADDRQYWSYLKPSVKEAPPFFGFLPRTVKEYVSVLAPTHRFSAQSHRDTRCAARRSARPNQKVADQVSSIIKRGEGIRHPGPVSIKSAK